MSTEGVNWTAEQNRIIVEAYGEMLEKQETGEQFVKAQVNRMVQERTRKTEGSVHRKFCNISFLLQELGQPIVAGYTPLPNTQRGLLHEAIYSGLLSTDNHGEDTTATALEFALEKHLEEFLVANWKSTALGNQYDIYEKDGVAGQQFKTDTGRIDILAISNDRKELLVVELKKGQASDAVVGQIQRYMSYVLDELADNDQTVRGAIIAFGDDPKIRRALKIARDIDFYRYEVNFTLNKE